jgi:hypothetical protein
LLLKIFACERNETQLAGAAICLGCQPSDRLPQPARLCCDGEGCAEAVPAGIRDEIPHWNGKKWSDVQLFSLTGPA